MGAILKAHCACGFQQDIVIGGTRKNFLTNALFPFYCARCGLIEINVHDTKKCCPQCASDAISAYGTEETTQPHGDKSFISAGRYSASNKWHLCPSCKMKTMEFGYPHLRFD